MSSNMLSKCRSSEESQNHKAMDSQSRIYTVKHGVSKNKINLTFKLESFILVGRRNTYGPFQDLTTKIP